MRLANLIGLIAAILVSTHCQKMGPFDVELKSFESCGKSTDGYYMDARLRKYNRTMFAMDGNLTINSELDDTVKGVLSLSVATHNGWKDNFFKSEFPEMCKFLKQWTWDWIVAMSKHGNFPAQCPMKKGSYWVKNFPLSLAFSSLPAFTYNKYKWRMALTKNNRQYACVQGMVDIVPKRKH